MSRRLADPTASQGIARAGRGHTYHAAQRGRMDRSCRADGGSAIHRRKGFWCPRCAELDQDTEANLLARLDHLVGGGFHG